MSQENKKKPIFDKLESTVILAFLVYGVIPSDANQFLVVSSLVLKYYCIVAFTVLAVISFWSGIKSISNVKGNTEIDHRLLTIPTTLFLFSLAMIYSIVVLAMTEVLPLLYGFIISGIPAFLVFIGLVLLIVGQFRALKIHRENSSN